MHIALIYPHQLFLPHPAVAAGRVIFLIEDPLLFGNDPEWPTAMHVQKLVLHRASMRAYAEELRSLGHDVRHVECPDGDTTDSAGLLEQVLPRGLSAIHVADPEDFVLKQRLERFASQRGLELHLHASPNFLTPASFLEAQIGRRKKPFMANFYKAQRQRMRILIDGDGEPLGGRWSFDEENRKKLPKGHQPPAEPMQAANDHVKAAKTWAKRPPIFHPATHSPSP